MTKEEAINILIKDCDSNKISDGYHTFGELYFHRTILFIVLCRELDDTGKGEVWRSKRHSDGVEWPGWYLLGIGTEKGKQITYHLPMDTWKETEFAKELDIAPEFDGHTSNLVIIRLLNL